jgi:hypothetical protein
LAANRSLRVVSRCLFRRQILAGHLAAVAGLQKIRASPVVHGLRLFSPGALSARRKCNAAAILAVLNSVARRLCAADVKNGKCSHAKLAGMCRFH